MDLKLKREDKNRVYATEIGNLVLELTVSYSQNSHMDISTATATLNIWKYQDGEGRRALRWVERNDRFTFRNGKLLKCCNVNNLLEDTIMESLQQLPRNERRCIGQVFELYNKMQKQNPDCEWPARTYFPGYLPIEEYEACGMD